VTREIEITGDERNPEHVEEIALLAVDPAWHRRGVGRALMPSRGLNSCR
jgi:ribosomal protein S18 acetylase RimI-like enzyme